MDTGFSLDAALAPALAIRGPDYDQTVLRHVARQAGYAGNFVVDINLCDPCMDQLELDKTKSWMGHSDEEGGVRCDACGRMEARLCFAVRNWA